MQDTQLELLNITILSTIDLRKKEIPIQLNYLIMKKCKNLTYCKEHKKVI